MVLLIWLCNWRMDFNPLKGVEEKVCKSDANLMISNLQFLQKNAVAAKRENTAYTGQQEPSVMNVLD